MDGVLELTDARIKIVTPIPGQQSGAKAGEGSSESSADNDGEAAAEATA